MKKLVKALAYVCFPKIYSIHGEKHMHLNIALAGYNATIASAIIVYPKVMQ